MYSYGPHDFGTGHALKRRSGTLATPGIAALLFICTIVIRLPNFGNPTYHVDEAFYLFVGEGMVDGLLPYRDLWDRKPAGLFILYAAIAQFGSVYAYQTVAALFAWGTALAVAAMASRFTGRVAAWAAGICYLAMIGALAGGGGQSPVFYNLFIATAALLVMRRMLGERSSGGWPTSEAAMLLCGLALTLKPTALPEAVFLGMALLWVQWRENRRWVQLFTNAMKLVAIGVAPTAFIWIGFAWAGMLEDYWFASMRSIFLTAPVSQASGMVKLAYLAGVLWVVALTAGLGMAILLARARRNRGDDRIIGLYMLGWLAAACVGFLLVPNFYDHYALPLASVMALASAPLFDRGGRGLVVAVVAISHLLLVSGFPIHQLERNAGARSGFTEAAALIANHAHGGCLFVYDASPALYRIARACPGNRYAFPEHLSNQREADAIGEDPVSIVRNMLAQRPSVVAIPTQPSVATPNLTTRRMLRRHLRQYYEKVGSTTLVDVVGAQNVEIWVHRANGQPPSKSNGAARAV